MDQIILKDKKVLVTGGNGFLGRNLIKKLLSYDSNVISLDIAHELRQTNTVYYNIDLLDLNQLKEAIYEIQPSIIYHLAASLDRTRDFLKANKILEVNLTGTVNLLNALRDIDYENLIFTSTSEVYGGKSTKSPFKEDDKFMPASPYSLSKYCAEMSIRTFSEIYKKNYTILRLFNFFGMNMPKNFFLPQLIDTLKKGKDFDMTNGEQVRDFLHLEDVLQAMISATIKKAYNEVFNVCSGEGKTIKEIALELKESLNSNSKINFGALPYRENEIWEMIGDNTKLRTFLNFTPKLQLQDLLNKIISHEK